MTVFRYNFRPEVDNDVISGVVVCVKFGDSWSNGFRGIRGADFVANEHDEAYPSRAKRLLGISPKMICVTLQF